MGREASRTGRRPAAEALVVVSLAMLVVGMNTTAIGVATRGMADELDASVATLEWIVGAYLLTGAAFALIGGRLGDDLGRKRLLVTGLGVFALGSAVAATAPSSSVLIAARAVQGLGAALVLPASIEVLAAFPIHGDPSAGFRVRGIVYASAFGIGPLVGGVLTDWISWRAVFVLELGLVVAALVVSVPLQRARSELPKRATSDLAGALVVAPLIILTVLTASQARRWGWSPMLAGALSALVVLALALRAVERRARHPLLHRGLLRDRVVVGANLATLGASVGMLGLVYFFNLFAQSAAVLGRTGVEVAAALVPFTVSIVAFSQIASALSRRIGYRGPVLAGLGLATFGFAWLSFVDASVTEAQIAVPLAVCGIGAGVANAGLTGPAVLVAQRARLDEAAGIVSLTRFLGSAIAIALGTATFLAVGTSDPTGAAATADPDATMVGSSAYEQAVATLEEDLRGPFEAAVSASTVDAFAATMRLTAVVLGVITLASAALLGGRATRHARTVHLRPIDDADHPRILELNEASVHHLSPLDPDRLAWLVSLASFAVVAVDDGGSVVGFALAFEPGTAYDSENYRWWAERADDFVYLDRIVVAREARRTGVGTVLYDELEAVALGHGCVVAEIDLEPPNPASLAFHSARGYTERGRRDDGGKVLSMVRLDLS